MAAVVCNPLTDHQIAALARDPDQRRRDGLRARIAREYEPLVLSAARKYQATGEPFEDLSQEGMIGLMTAIDGYDPAKGIKFSTYAMHFVLGHIKHYLRDKGKLIKEPAWLQEVNQKI